MTSLFEQGSTRRDVLPLDFMIFDDRLPSLLEFGVAECDASMPIKMTLSEVEYEAQSQIPSDMEDAIEGNTMLDDARVEAATETTLSLELGLQLRLEEERAKVATICSAFVSERQKYFADAESEVVRLALAIAARILSREISGDPTHLTDTIKAALAKVRDGSLTQLHVREEESAAWKQSFAGEEQLEVVVDARLAYGECVLQTKVGSVALGVRAQLEEIERSFSEWMGVASSEEALPC